MSDMYDSDELTDVHAVAPAITPAAARPDSEPSLRQVVEGALQSKCVEKDCTFFGKQCPNGVCICWDEWQDRIGLFRQTFDPQLALILLNELDKATG